MLTKIKFLNYKQNDSLYTVLVRESNHAGILLVYNTIFTIYIYLYIFATYRYSGTVKLCTLESFISETREFEFFSEAFDFWYFL